MPRAALFALAALLVAAPLARADDFIRLAPADAKAGDLAEFEARFRPAKAKPGEAVTLTLTVRPKPGCYTYPFTPPEHQDSRNSYLPLPGAVVKPDGAVADPANYKEKPNALSPTDLDRYYPDAVTWDIPVKVAATAKPGKQAVRLVGLSLQVCTERKCFPIGVDQIPSPELEVLEGATPATPTAPPAVKPEPVVTRTATTPAATSTVVPKPLAQYAADLARVREGLTGSPGGAAGQGGLGGLLAAAIFWGFVSLATPCVFPMIPITVSLFLKQANQSTGTVLRLAGVYSLTIIVMLGSAAVLLLATFQALSINEWMNYFLGALFVFFATSLLGLFEVSLPRIVSFGVACGWVFVGYHLVQVARHPQDWSNAWKLGLGLGALALVALSYVQLSGMGAAFESRLLQSTERGRQAGGVLGTVAGAVAFSLVSFTCVAPFLGGFAGVLQSGGYSQFDLILAGLAFATAFASPFFVLALFPSLVKKLPKSGGWLDTVKAVMGFLELAAAFKFFRTAELRVFTTTEYFTYDVCLAAWIAIAIAAGLYLLNAYRLAHEVAPEHVGVGRLLTAIAFFGLAAYLAPGLVGHRPAGGVYAWVNAFLLPESDAKSEAELPWGPDLPRALEEGRSAPFGQRQLVFIDFTGVTCSNCKLNERNVFTQPAVRDAMQQYRLVQLYTDAVPAGFYAPAPGLEGLNAEAVENLGFQKAAFGSIQRPLYVILEPRPDGTTVIRGVYDEGKINDVNSFLAYLRGPLGK